MTTPLDEHYQRLAADFSAKRKRREQRLIEDIESGLVPGRVTRMRNGAVSIHVYRRRYTPYDTRTLVKLVTEAFERNEAAGRGRICWINSNRGGLQIKGKHLTRLKKKLPGLTQSGNILRQD